MQSNIWNKYMYTSLIWPQDVYYDLKHIIKKQIAVDDLQNDICIITCMTQSHIMNLWGW